MKWMSRHNKLTGGVGWKSTRRSSCSLPANKPAPRRMRKTLSRKPLWRLATARMTTAHPRRHWSLRPCAAGRSTWLGGRIAGPGESWRRQHLQNPGLIPAWKTGNLASYTQTLKKTAGCLLALTTLMATNLLRAADADEQTEHSSAGTATATAGGGGAGGGGSGGVSRQSEIVIHSIEPIAGDREAPHKDRPWLGVSVEEGSEALTAQLGLAPGAGLVVTYVTPDSPAAKAGLEKNDVLAELESQLLVHPSQLRKLIQGRNEGEAIELTFYRAGKKQTASATLGKTPAGFGWFDQEHSWKVDMPRIREMIPPKALRDQIEAFRESLEHMKVDQSKVQGEVRHSLEQALKALQDELQYSSNAAWGPAAKALKELQHARSFSEGGSSVTVRSTGQRVKSVVKADESGTIVLVSNPKPHLTAHDMDGKLVFDGEIDTPEQREKVPPDLWEKVEPMLDKVAPKAEDEPEAKPAPPPGTPPRVKRPAIPMPPGAERTL